MFFVRAMALSDPQWQSIAPKRELVFPVGEPAGNDDRRWRFTPEDLEMVAADFATRAEPAPVLYRHGDDPARGGAAAGWIDRVEVAPDGLYAFIRYGERAMEEIRDGGWGYRSPGFDAEQDEEGFWRPRRLSEVSLVNDPAIAGMPPIQASTSATPNATTEPAATDGDNRKEESPMADSKTVTAAKKNSAAFDKAGLLGVIRETFAMPEAISDEMLIDLLKKAVEDVVEEVKDMAPEEPAMDLPMPAAASVEKPRIELVEDETATKAARERIKSLVASAVSAGKVTSATLEASIRFCSADPDGFAEWAEVAPVLAPAPGQVVHASAADRAPVSTADRLTAKYRNQQASRPHFTQRGN
jgi:phage I-like protein